MKIIFDSEEQKDKFFSTVVFEFCPDELGLARSDCHAYKCCRDCWDDTNLETEIAEKEKKENE